MPEELKTSRELIRGFVSTNRPAPSPLQDLGKALGAFTDLGSGILDTKLREELDEAEKLLKNPLLTEEEAKEIERDALSPLVKMRARNRQGEAVVQREFEGWRQEILDAPDSIEARRILREKQADILGRFGSDPDIAAGIHERVARLAPSVLDDAAKRRAAILKRDEEIATSEDLRLNLNHGGPHAFVETLFLQLKDEKMTSGDIPGLLDRGIETIENFWMEGDDEDSNSNLHEQRAVEAIDLVLDSLPLESTERKGFNALRTKIDTDSERRLRARISSQKESKTAIHAEDFRELVRWNQNHPDTPIPESLREQALNSAPTASAAESVLEWMDENTVPMGVLHTDIWKDGESLLKAQFTAHASSIDAQIGAVNQIGTGDIGVSFPDLVAAYKAYGAALPPTLRDDPAELLRLREAALAEAPKAAERRQEQRNQTAVAVENIKVERAGQIAALNRSGQHDRAENLRKKMNAEIRGLLATQHNEAISDWLGRQGIDPSQYVNPLE